MNLKTILAGLSLATVSLTAQAVVPNPYAAIAYSPSDGLYGIAQKSVVLEGAEQEAMGNCAVIAGGQDCRIVVSFGNGCAALAVNDDGAYGAGFGKTTKGELMVGINKAYAVAREACEGRGGTSCRLEQAFCSFDDNL